MRTTLTIRERHILAEIKYDLDMFLESQRKNSAGRRKELPGPDFCGYMVVLRISKKNIRALIAQVRGR